MIEGGRALDGGPGASGLCAPRCCRARPPAPPSPLHTTSPTLTPAATAAAASPGFFWSRSHTRSRKTLLRAVGERGWVLLLLLLVAAVVAAASPSWGGCPKNGLSGDWLLPGDAVSISGRWRLRSSMAPRPEGGGGGGGIAGGTITFLVPLGLRPCRLSVMFAGTLTVGTYAAASAANFGLVRAVSMPRALSA